jgi:thiaminase/transcriptional activator TenA
MTLSDDLWQENQALAQDCLQHPFVQGIATGTLPPDRFTDYVGQDAFFLNAFARAYSLAAAKAPNLSQFETFHLLADGVLLELRLHQRYALQWGVDLQQVTPGSATQRYTDFLLATAWSQPIARIVVAMAPCMRLYAFLGKTIAASGIPTHAYRDWIQTYSSPDFDDLAQQLEALIDQQATATAEMRSTYRYAMQCERDFFQAAWEKT